MVDSVRLRVLETIQNFQLACRLSLMYRKTYGMKCDTPIGNIELFREHAAELYPQLVFFILVFYQNIYMCVCVCVCIQNTHLSRFMSMLTFKLFFSRTIYIVMNIIINMHTHAPIIYHAHTRVCT